MPPLVVNGAEVWQGFLAREAQAEIVEAVRDAARAAPPRRMETPWGKPMSVAMTSAGRVGWVSSKAGYAYLEARPEGGAWPAIPEPVLAVWRAVSGWPDDPDCCLVNWYGEGAKMGLHVDRDEGRFDAPVVSISLGDPGLFRVGGTRRKDPTRSVWLESGDVARLAGEARLAYHGIDRIRFGASRLLAQGGRLNLTLRVVA
ncbi:MAG: alpha-ketoglutarate-dependent dioxygenase AlkB [Paracoccaceae bacterium]